MTPLLFAAALSTSTQQSSSSPSSSTTEPLCHDLPLKNGEEWSDNEGSTCKDYKSHMAQSWCSLYGNDPSYANNNITAIHACCTCGGGCTDWTDWEDTYGENCNTYTQTPEICESDSSYADDDTIIYPHDACCSCGGGTNNTAPSSTTTAPKNKNSTSSSSSADTTIVIAISVGAALFIIAVVVYTLKKPKKNTYILL